MSDVRRDANGSVYHVGATMMTWLLNNDPTVNSIKFNRIIFDLIENRDVIDFVFRRKEFIRCGKRSLSNRHCTAISAYRKTFDFIRWLPAGKMAKSMDGDWQSTDLNVRAEALSSVV